jgi:hypothetical protein
MNEPPEIKELALEDKPPASRHRASPSTGDSFWLLSVMAL